MTRVIRPKRWHRPKGMPAEVKRRALNRAVWAVLLVSIAAGLYSIGDIPASRLTHSTLKGPNVRSLSTAAAPGGCNVKGNISVRGERIYHVPGQTYYAATTIDRRKGERWFCSEWQAWWAGWRKAKL